MLYLVELEKLNFMYYDEWKFVQRMTRSRTAAYIAMPECDRNGSSDVFKDFIFIQKDKIALKT